MTLKQQNEIRNNNSEIPVIRAGFSNTLLFLYIILFLLVNQIMNEAGINYYWKVIVFCIGFLIAFKIYNKSISKISKMDDRLVLVVPLSKVDIDLTLIKEIKVVGLPASQSILFIIKKKNKLLPELYHFVALSTSVGCYSETMQKIKEFEEIGVKL